LDLLKTPLEHSHISIPHQRHFIALPTVIINFC
jgi:hypothetical protein